MPLIGTQREQARLKFAQSKQRRSLAKNSAKQSGIFCFDQGVTSFQFRRVVELNKGSEHTDKELLSVSPFPVYNSLLPPTLKQTELNRKQWTVVSQRFQKRENPLKKKTTKNNQIQLVIAQNINEQKKGREQEQEHNFFPTAVVVNNCSKVVIFCPNNRQGRARQTRRKRARTRAPVEAVPPNSVLNCTLLSLTVRLLDENTNTI